jgi:crossover junction endodeoxyribonuclease RuvC
MRILGIDPGSVATGWGVVERLGSGCAHVAHGTVRPRRGTELPTRLADLHAAITRVVATHAPEHVVVERVFVGRSVRSALVLGQARGAVLAALAGSGLGIEEVTAQHVKLAVTGSGAAEKAQVQAMVKRLLALAETPPRDAADALAAALSWSPLAAARLTAGAARGLAIRGRAGRANGLGGSRVVVRRVL